jgi:hypothetical protein
MFRKKAPVLSEINSLSSTEYKSLCKNGLANGGSYWDQKDNPEKKLIEKFKKEVKNHYYSWQIRRCCYCSRELHEHKMTYDAEHILDKDEYSEFMFAPNNFSVACKHCNIKKSNKKILFSTGKPTEVPIDTSAYSIVHPHLDEWNAHLDFDTVKRIVAQPGSTKGVQTIDICGIEALNAITLADHFHPGHRDEVEEYLLILLTEPDDEKQLEVHALLTELTTIYQSAEAEALLMAWGK